MARRTRRAGWAGRALIAPPALLFACLGYSWLTLPDVRPLRTEPPDQTAFMALRALEAEAGETRRQWQWISYRQISPNLRRAVLVTEDAGFWDHDGVDYGELRVSIENAWRDRTPPRGASTITQQLAKNLYLSPSRNPYRKIQELMIARRLEAELGKARILELYLNVVEWGDNVWGAEAAARTYFGRSAATLTSSQAALLAGALINPRVYSPARPNGRLLARQRLILRRMGVVRTPEPGTADEPPAPPAASLPVDPAIAAPGPAVQLTAPVEP